MGTAVKVTQAAMSVIHSSQGLINNPQREGKEILFGPAFLQAVEQRYSLLFHTSIPHKKHPIIESLLTHLPLVNEMNRTLIYDSGIGFKGLIPATYVSQLAHLLSINQQLVKLKFTTTTQLLRNSLNAPDDWESKAMANVQQPGWLVGKMFFDKNATTEKRSTYRILRPLHFDQSCLQCHGTPKDNPLNTAVPQAQWSSIDITGFKMESVSVGQFAGAISFSIFKGL